MVENLDWLILLYLDDPVVLEFGCNSANLFIKILWRHLHEISDSLMPAESAEILR